MTNVRFAENITRRKEDLQRFIQTLQQKLDLRKKQLAMHEHVEQVLTAREAMETQRYADPTEADFDPQWHAIMERGREMYGDEWDQEREGHIPLG